MALTACPHLVAHARTRAAWMSPVSRYGTDMHCGIYPLVCYAEAEEQLYRCSREGAEVPTTKSFGTRPEERHQGVPRMRHSFSLA